MMSRDATSRLCVTFLAMSARGLRVSWNPEESLDNPSLSASLSSPAISAVLHCGAGVAFSPRFRGPVAPSRGPWRYSISQMVTGKDVSLVLQTYRDAVTAFSECLMT